MARFFCSCGNVILLKTEREPYLFHIIQKQKWEDTVDRFFESIDDIKSPTNWISDKDYKSGSFFSLMLDNSREAIHCTDCKRLWLQSLDGEYIEFEQVKKNENLV